MAKHHAVHNWSSTNHIPRRLRTCHFSAVDPVPNEQFVQRRRDVEHARKIWDLHICTGVDGHVLYHKTVCVRELEMWVLVDIPTVAVFGKTSGDSWA